MKIAAVFGQVGSDTPKSYLERMCKAQLACDWHEYSVFEVPGGAIGIVRTSEKFGKIPMFIKGKNGNLLAISGVPIKGGKLNEFLHRVVEMNSDDASQALTEMDGAYAALFWQADEKKALLITDFMGFQPVYLHKASKGIAIASEIKAFSVGGVVPVEPDPAGWGAFCIFGHTVGDSTQLANVSRLRGVTLSYSPVANFFESSKYWDWPSRHPDMVMEEVPLQKIIDFFKEDILAYEEYGVSQNTLLMSSGFDSRFLLYLLSELGLSIQTLSVSQQGHYFGAEGKLGQKVAKYFGVKDARLVSPFIGFEAELAKLRFLVLNDVSTPGGALFISKVAGRIEDISGAIWEGFAPGQALTQLTDSNMVNYLDRIGFKFNSEIWSTAELLFSDNFIDNMKKELSSVVLNEINSYGEDDYGVTRFVHRNRGLNRISQNPYKVYSNSVIPFSPGLSKKVWDITYSFPPFRLCKNKQILKKIFHTNCKKALNIPMCTEKGLYMPSNRLSLYVFLANFLYEVEYKWERRHRAPFIGKYIWKKNDNENKSTEKDLIEIVLSEMKNCELFKTINSQKFYRNKPTNLLDKKSKLFVFYLVLWHLVMSGDVDQNECDSWLIQRRTSF